MQISANINNHQQKLNFQGLNRYLTRHFAQEGIGVISKKTVCGSDLVLEAIKANPKSRRFVGNLPHDWIERLPKENRKEQIQKVQDLFANMAKILYSPMESYNRAYSKNLESINKFREQFKELLGLDIKISLLEKGKGGFSKVYRLETNNKSYIFKVFHSDKYKLNHINSSWKLIEAARAPFVMRTSKKSFAKFYFGKIASLKDKDGFMLTEYLEEKELSEKQQYAWLLRLLSSPVISLDLVSRRYPVLKNLINYKIYDYGELVHQPAEFLEQFKPRYRKIDPNEINKTVESNRFEIKTESTLKDKYDYKRTLNFIASAMTRDS